MCDPVQVWQLLDDSNSLVALAIRVLSFCPNSASAERLFSIMGNIKDKKRNRMLTQKLRDLAFLQLELRHKHAKEGLVRQRLKRSFGNHETNSSPTTKEPGCLDDVIIVKEMEEELANQVDSGEADNALADPETGSDGEPTVGNSISDSSSFTSLLNSLHPEESSDDEEENSPNASVQQASTQPTMPRTVRVFFGCQCHIPIETIFSWQEEKGWDKYWFSGVKNCRQEMEFYETILQAEEKDDENLRTGASDTGQQLSSHQIVIDDK